MDAVLAQGGFTVAGVGEVGIAAVDDDIAGIEQRGAFDDHVVVGLTGLHQDDQTPAAAAETISFAGSAAMQVPSWPNSGTRAMVRAGVRLWTAAV
ncbi:hypothetical protein AB0N87_26175 [Streptomyces sp. NPDC093228]|uniref:hypothetical protein n=1 Tax=Streptomyces sp. NPDC093228 TaxID=3155070 RepID=UPI0034334298